MDARLLAIYRDIQRQRDERLAQILRVLDQKAATDPEIAQVAQLLRLWTSDSRRERTVPREGSHGRETEISSADQKIGEDKAET